MIPRLGRGRFWSTRRDDAQFMPLLGAFPLPVDVGDDITQVEIRVTQGFRCCW